MTSILLTGIPGIGKSQIVGEAQELAFAAYANSVAAISLGQLVGDEAYRLWRTPGGERANLDYALQQTLRSYAIAEASHRLQAVRADHVLVETPLSLYLRGTVPNVTFSPEQIGELHRAAGGFRYVVTLIDDEEVLAGKLEGTPYPADPDCILDWVGLEVEASHLLTPPYAETLHAPRNLVIPTAAAAENLVKLLADPDPPIGYLGFPMTHLKSAESDTPAERSGKDDARRRIAAFQDAWSACSVVICPLQASDLRISERKTRDNIVYRDKHWFARHADYMLAFFPQDVLSLGVVDEMKYVASTGKPVILVHPNKRYLEEAFGIHPTLYARNEEELFEELHRGGTALAERFLVNGKPRFSLLQDAMKGRHPVAERAGT